MEKTWIVTNPINDKILKTSQTGAINQKTK
jgi:hypothetical protein